MIFRRHDPRYLGRVNDMRGHDVRVLSCRILIHSTKFPDISHISWPARQDSVSKGDRRENSNSETGTRSQDCKAILNLRAEIFARGSRERQR